MTLSDIVLTHIAASCPVSVKSTFAYCLEQYPGWDSATTNWLRNIQFQEAVNELLHSKKIELDINSESGAVYFTLPQPIETKPIEIEVCQNDEWLRQWYSDCDSESAAIAIDNLWEALIIAGFYPIVTRRDRTLFHGWNGCTSFNYKYGPIGSFDRLTAGQLKALDRMVSENRHSVDCE